jgi:hypothetical protein
MVRYHVSGRTPRPAYFKAELGLILGGSDHDFSRVHASHDISRDGHDLDFMVALGTTNCRARPSAGKPWYFEGRRRRGDRGDHIGWGGVWGIWICFPVNSL